MNPLKQEVSQQSIQQVLPVSVLAGSIAGIPINTVILWLTLLYLIIQIAVIIPKARDALRHWRRGGSDACKR